jgi:chromosomal replication initiation ATPase DnaA
MKNLTQIKTALKAPMYSKLTEKELTLYRTGFKNGYRMAQQMGHAKLEREMLKLKYKQDKYNEKNNGKDNVLQNFTKDLFNKVVHCVCKEYNLSPDTLLGVRRYEELVRARSILINLMLETYAISLSQLGRFMNIDHSTVIHHKMLKLEQKRFWKLDKTIHEEFTKLKDQLTTS